MGVDRTHDLDGFNDSLTINNRDALRMFVNNSPSLGDDWMDISPNAKVFEAKSGLENKKNQDESSKNLILPPFK